MVFLQSDKLCRGTSLVLPFAGGGKLSVLPDPEEDPAGNCNLVVVFPCLSVADIPPPMVYL